MGSRAGFGPVREMGWTRPGLAPGGFAQFLAPLGAGFFHFAGGRAVLSDPAQTALAGWIMQGFSVEGKRYDQANDEVVIPAGDRLSLFQDSGGSIYYVPTSQNYVPDTHRGARASLIGVSAPVVSGETQEVDLADAAGTSVLRIMHGDPGERAAYVAFAPAALQ